MSREPNQNDTDEEGVGGEWCGGCVEVFGGDAVAEDRATEFAGVAINAAVQAELPASGVPYGLRKARNSRCFSSRSDSSFCSRFAELSLSRMREYTCEGSPELLLVASCV